MAIRTIRQLDDGVYDRLRSRAQRNNRSIEAEVRQILEDRTRTATDWVADLRDFHARMAAEHPPLPDSTPLIRQIRDEE